MADANHNAVNNLPYDHSRYILDVRLASNPEDPEGRQEWLAFLSIKYHDLPQLMQEGLFWTTANVVPELGCIKSTPYGGKPNLLQFNRERGLREWPDKPADQCRWVGTVTFCSLSFQHSANFTIPQLSRAHVVGARAGNKERQMIFGHSILNPDMENVNCIYAQLQPSFGSWWIWPMETMDAPPVYTNAIEAEG